MSKEENQINRLMDAIFTISEIRCSKCGAHESVNGDEIDCASHFRDCGWHATDYNVYCPKCYAKRKYKVKPVKTKKPITVNTIQPQFFAASAYTSFNPVVYTKPDTRMKIGTKKKKPGPITGTTY